MKFSIMTKLLIAYLLLGVIGLLSISTLSAKLTQVYLEDHYGSELYDRVNAIAQDCRQLYTGGSSQFTYDSLDGIASALDADVWLVRADGTVSFDSSRRQTGVLLRNFDPSAGGNRNYMIGNYFGYYKNGDVLTVSAPISANFTTYGYVMIHQSMDTIYAAKQAVLNVQYLIFLILYAVAFLLLLLVRFIVLKPLSRISNAAMEYA